MCEQICNCLILSIHYLRDTPLGKGVRDLKSIKGKRGKVTYEPNSGKVEDLWISESSRCILSNDVPRGEKMRKT